MLCGWLMATGLSARSAAIALAMTMRWSLAPSTLPPCRRSTPSMMRPSTLSLIVAPRAPRAFFGAEPFGVEDAGLAWAEGGGGGEGWDEIGYLCRVDGDAACLIAAGVEGAGGVPGDRGAELAEEVFGGAVALFGVAFQAGDADVAADSGGGEEECGLAPVAFDAVISRLVALFAGNSPAIGGGVDADAGIGEDGDGEVNVAGALQI